MTTIRSIPIAVLLAVACATPAAASTVVAWVGSAQVVDLGSDTRITPVSGAMGANAVIGVCLGTTVSLMQTLDGVSLLSYRVEIDPPPFEDTELPGFGSRGVPFLMSAVANGDAPTRVGLRRLIERSTNLRYLLDESIQPPRSRTPSKIATR